MSSQSGAYRPHRLFTGLAERYGTVFIMRVGLHWTLVVSGLDAARECFTTNDRVFATRPIGYAHKVMGYDCAMFAFAPYGPYWCETRKIATFTLLTAHRLEQLKHEWALEMDICVKEMFGQWVGNGRRPVSVKMNQLFEDIMFNIIMRVVAGKRYLGDDVSEADEEVAQRFRRVAKEFNRFLAVTVVYDALPFIGWLDWKGDIKAMRRTHEEMDVMMQGWVDEHRLRRGGAGLDSSTKKDQDFIDVLLSMEEDGSLKVLHQDTNVVVKATALNLVIAGVENTASTLVWAITLLLKHRHVLDKAQAELDAHVGKDRVVDESDIASLAYLQAIVKETLRLYPAAPFLVPHQAMDDCYINGYRISRGTRLIVNAWMIQRDPRVWSDPHEFRPERFITGHVHMEIKGRNFEIIPFGSGRRSCPGAEFSIQVMQLILARLLQAFDWMAHADVGVDMEEGYGVSLCKLNPLPLLFKPRLPEQLYM